MNSVRLAEVVSVHGSHLFVINLGALTCWREFVTLIFLNPLCGFVHLAPFQVAFTVKRFWEIDPFSRLVFGVNHSNKRWG